MKIQLLLTALFCAISANTSRAAPTTPQFKVPPPRTGYSQLETGVYHIEVDSRSTNTSDERDAKLLCEALVAQIAKEGDYEVLAWREAQYEAAEGSHFTGTSHSIVIWTSGSNKTYEEAFLKYTGRAAPDRPRK